MFVFVRIWGKIEDILKLNVDFFLQGYKYLINVFVRLQKNVVIQIFISHFLLKNIPSPQKCFFTIKTFF